MPELASSRIRAAVKDTARAALDLLFPINCLGCGKEGSVICVQCAGNLPRLERPYCDICAQPGIDGQCEPCLEHPNEIDGIRAPYLFDGPLREAVHRLKYRGWKAAAPVLGGLMADYLEDRKIPGQALVPVPLHPRRLRGRGYNQSHLLAKETGKMLDIPVRQDLLVRTKDSPPQVETTSSEERRANVAGIFQASPEARGTSVILVDDVTTTGSTLFACAETLKDAGAESVWGLVLAKDS